MGVSFLKNKLLEHEGLIEAYNNKWHQYFACDISYQKEKSIYGFSAKISGIGLGTTAYHVDYGWGSLVESERFSIDMLNLGFYYSLDLFKINLIKTSKRFEINPNIEVADYFMNNPKYAINAKFQPFVGLNFLKSQKNINWEGGQFSFGDTSFITHYGFETSKFQGKAFYGISCNLGLKLQFYNHRRESLACNVFYNQGFINMLKTNYKIGQKSKSGDSVIFKGEFASKGSYIGLGYPTL